MKYDSNLFLDHFAFGNSVVIAKMMYLFSLKNKIKQINKKHYSTKPKPSLFT